MTSSSYATDGAATVSTVTLRAADRLAALLAVRVLIAASAELTDGVTIEAVTSTLAALTVRVTSSAREANSARRRVRKAFRSNVSTVPATVKSTVTIDLYEAPGRMGGEAGGRAGGRGGL